MKTTILTIVITAIVMALLPLIILATGWIDMGATNDSGAVERNLAALAVQSSLEVRAAEEANPFEGDEEAVSIGLSHYSTMCLRCHGGPGVEPQEFALGLNPSPPKLDHAAEEFTAGELFWITKDGIRMSGMPAFGSTHEDEDIWKIVAFVEELADLTEEQKQALSEGSQSSHDNGGSSGGHESESTDNQEESSHQHEN